jgi:restriction endonuclease S subunit
MCDSIKDNNNFLLLYVYYIIPIIKDTIITNGSTISWLNKTNIGNMFIPIPKSEEKIKEWTDKISKPFDDKIKKQDRINKIESLITKTIKNITENKKCEDVSLGDLCEIKSGKAINSENRIGSIYPYYAANGISGYVDEYLFDGKYIICAQDGSIGATHYVNNKFYASNHVWVLKVNKIHNFYLLSILKNLIDYTKLTSGSVIPKLTKEKISNIKIKLPLNKQLITDMNPLFEELEILQNEVSEADKLYKKYINELSEEALPNKISKNDNLSEESLLEISNKNNEPATPSLVGIHTEEPIIKVSKKKVSKNDKPEEPIIKVSKKKVSKKDDSNNSSEESLLGLTNKQILKDDDLIKTSKKKVIKKKVIIQNTI